MDAFDKNNQSQIINFGDIKFTFVNICLQSYFLQSYKDFLYIGLIFFLELL